MKLKKGFVIHNTSSDYVAVATGEAGEKFNGMIRNNKTANTIFELLMTDTTVEAIVDKMAEKYDAPREVIEADVISIIAKLKEAGFIDE